jgi:hypothetical protein
MDGNEQNIENFIGTSFTYWKKRHFSFRGICCQCDEYL